MNGSQAGSARSSGSPHAGTGPANSGRKEHTLSLVNVGIVLAAVVIAATGQVLLRYGMRHAAVGRPGTKDLVLYAVTSPSVLGGLAVFGISAILWLWALSRMPLSVAYPFNGLGFILILIASRVFLDEKIHLFTGIGVVLVALGITCVALAA